MYEKLDVIIWIIGTFQEAKKTVALVELPANSNPPLIHQFSLKVYHYGFKKKYILEKYG